MSSVDAIGLSSLFWPALRGIEGSMKCGSEARLQGDDTGVGFPEWRA
jgi:hypothetical protein